MSVVWRKFQANLHFNHWFNLVSTGLEWKQVVTAVKALGARRKTHLSTLILILSTSLEGLGVGTRSRWLVPVPKKRSGEAISLLVLLSFWETVWFHIRAFPPQKCQHDVAGAEHILCCDRYQLTPIYVRHRRDASPSHDMNTLSPPTCNGFSIWESEASLKEEKSHHLEVSRRKSS